MILTPHLRGIDSYLKQAEWRGEGYLKIQLKRSCFLIQSIVLNDIALLLQRQHKNATQVNSGTLHWTSYYTLSMVY